MNREFPAAVRLAIRERAHDLCEVCHAARITHIHHRLMKSQGGMGTVANGLGCCHKCHQEIHANPAESYELGYLLHAWSDEEGTA